MLKANEKTKVAEQIDRMLGTFSGSRTVDPESTLYFVEDVAEFSMQAITETIIRFRKGKIPDRNNAFPPTVAEFVSAVRARQEEIDIQAFWDKTDFVEFDTPVWRALCRQRGRSMPQIERRGKIGWYVPKDEVAGVPAQLVEEERALLEHREPRVVTPMLRKM